MKDFHEHLFRLLREILPAILLPASSELSQVLQPSGESGAAVSSPSTRARAGGTSRDLLGCPSRSVLDLQLCVQVPLPQLQGHVLGLSCLGTQVFYLLTYSLAADVIVGQPQCHHCSAGCHLQFHEIVLTTLQRPILCRYVTGHLLDDATRLASSLRGLLSPLRRDTAHNDIAASLYGLTDHGLQPV